jgi:hypothetical protein
MKWNPEVEDGHFKQQNTTCRMGICLNNPQKDYIYINKLNHISGFEHCSNGGAP